MVCLFDIEYIYFQRKHLHDFFCNIYNFTDTYLTFTVSHKWHCDNMTLNQLRDSASLAPKVSHFDRHFDQQKKVSSFYIIFFTGALNLWRNCLLDQMVISNTRPYQITYLIQDLQYGTPISTFLTYIFTSVS